MSSEWVKAGKVWRGYRALEVLSESGTGRALARKKEALSSGLPLEPTLEPASSSLPIGEALPTPKVSDFITRAVMRELCLVAHDCGLVQISHSELAERLGCSYQQIKRAIKRLESDGYLVRAKRGSGASGNRTPTGQTYKEKAPNLYLLARLSDKYGYQLPTRDFLEKSFYAYVRTSRYNFMSKEAQTALTVLIVNWLELVEAPTPDN